MAIESGPAGPDIIFIIQHLDVGDQVYPAIGLEIHSGDKQAAIRLQPTARVVESADSPNPLK